MVMMGPGENGPHVVLRWLTDITTSGYGYYCGEVRIFLRRVTDITASGYRYYCVGILIILRPGTLITEEA